jgi:hypothetical protein
MGWGAFPCQMQEILWSLEAFPDTGIKVTPKTELHFQTTYHMSGGI